MRASHHDDGAGPAGCDRGGGGRDAAQWAIGPALETVLAFGAAALLYLVTEELLVEAHEIPDTPLITAAFFVGSLILFVIEMIA